MAMTPWHNVTREGVTYREIPETGGSVSTSINVRGASDGRWSVEEIQEGPLRHDVTTIGPTIPEKLQRVSF